MSENLSTTVPAQQAAIETAFTALLMTGRRYRRRNAQAASAAW